MRTYLLIHSQVASHADVPPFSAALGFRMRWLIKLGSLVVSASGWKSMQCRLIPTACPKTAMADHRPLRTVDLSPLTGRCSAAGPRWSSNLIECLLPWAASDGTPRFAVSQARLTIDRFSTWSGLSLPHAHEVSCCQGSIARVIAALDNFERHRLRELVLWLLEYEQPEAHVK